MPFSSDNEVLQLLATKSAHKQATFRNTIRIFDQIKTIGKNIEATIGQEMIKNDPSVVVEAKVKGAFEMDLKFSGDLLSFNMHTNVFVFNDQHPINALPYLKANPENAFFGMINIYNFLADTYKYNRLNDLGFLIARIFINKDNHFFVEGQGKLNFLYNDLVNNVISEETLTDIIRTAMVYTIEFDLEVPPIQQVQAISYGQKLARHGNEEILTGKKLGFQGSII